ncbi:tetratricopeptide repeat protein 33-like [Saccostrea echinata]|uniref:tetratricopeptide repeat protein 33-like n=1 Tax=Saccostrea echinata TaxID=191078 RepID=UPI002A82B7C7|nr:tetratricopeptide repeat protein 33-like [Saccostrea echinata]
MTSFGWKRKLGGNVSKKLSQSFQDNSKGHHDNLEEVDWLTLAPKRKVICLEDSWAKSERLKQEGSLLAESERYWEAISKWEEALGLNPNDETLHEMRAQSYLLLNEVYPAVQAAVKCTEINPLWWVGHQTLGRAQLGLGDVAMAVKSFSRAIRLFPDDEELWKEDLLWAKSLLDHQRVTQAEQSTKEDGCTVTEICDPPHKENCTVTEICDPPHKEKSTINEICDPPHKLTAICASSHNITGISDSSDQVDETFDHPQKSNKTCDSLSHQSKHISDAWVQENNKSNLGSSEQVKETKRIPQNYVRMRQHLSH